MNGVNLKPDVRLTEFLVVGLIAFAGNMLVTIPVLNWRMNTVESRMDERKTEIRQQIADLTATIHEIKRDFYVPRHQYYMPKTFSPSEPLQRGAHTKPQG